MRALTILAMVIVLTLVFTPGAAQVDVCREMADRWMSFDGMSLEQSGVEPFDYQVDGAGNANLPDGYVPVQGNLLRNGGYKIYAHPGLAEGQIITDPAEGARLMELQSTYYVAFFCDLVATQTDGGRMGQHNVIWYKVH